MSNAAAADPDADIRPHAPQAYKPPALEPAVLDHYNRTKTDFRAPMPRPKVNGIVIDFHCHLLADQHAPTGSRRPTTSASTSSCR
jgi:hypothetical protein